MSVGGISPGGGDLPYSGLYLSSIGFGYLYIQQPSEVIFGIIDFYLLGFILNLVSAVMWHEFLKSISGPLDNSVGPLTKTERIQRIGFTLFSVGTPSEYPDTYQKPIWSADLEIPTRRYIAFALFLGATAVLLVSFPYTIWNLAQYAVGNSAILPGAIGFLQLVFLLQTVLPDLWPSTYLIDSYKRPSINESVEQFSMAFWDDEDIEIVGGRYNPAGGGSFEITYETGARTSEEERRLLEELIVAYAGIIMPDDFPCQELCLTIREGETKVGITSLDSEEVREFRKGDKPIESLLDILLESMVFQENVNANPESPQ
jgi:hypothetical protein